MRSSLLAILFLTLTSCSVIAASSGSKEPDFSKVPVGANEEAVQAELGLPTTTVQSGAETIKVYNYKLGDKPATGRAVVYGLIDLVTIGLAEYILFPLEIQNSGNAYEAVVHYNEQGKVSKLIPKREVSGGEKVAEKQ